jgi:hypothetical protein
LRYSVETRRRSAVLDRLPLAQQIQIVKTLCWRTVATTKAHLHTTTAMSA